MNPARSRATSRPGSARNRAVFLLLLFLTAGSVRAEEGMYPVSELQSIDFRKAGLEISMRDVFDPSGGGLIDAVVNVGGCTGAFVSAKGLILTNHHCVNGPVQAASTVANDYVTHGFYARTPGEEIPARGMVARIIESYRDVSAEILSAVSDTMAPASRSRAIARRIREIERTTEEDRPGSRAEVAEMVPGTSWTLFIYRNFRDVRLVYVPPASIGNFGDEEDNWMWPRHTGDFSFVRAYATPDGTPADYAPSNVPYVPKRYLSVQPAGVEEEAAVFMLGYPGRTYRHRTASFLDYEQTVRLPYVADLYEEQMRLMKEIGASDRAVALKHDARLYSLANTSKNYRGKLRGLGRLDLVSQWLGRERELQAYIDAEPARRERYGSLIQEIDGVYADMKSEAPYELALDNLRGSSTLLGTALTLQEAGRERAKPDADRLADYADRNFQRTRDRLAGSLRNYHMQTDRALLADMLRRAALLPEGRRIPPVDALLAGRDTSAAIEPALDRLYGGTRLADTALVLRILDAGGAAAAEIREPVMDLARELLPLYDSLRSVRQSRDGMLSRLFADFIEVKRGWKPSAFIPDGNGTLRFTYGRVRGYAPRDGIRSVPFTTVEGIVEKTTGVPPFDAPAALTSAVAAKNFGRFASPRLGSVPVALLYNLDTTGGNSGSPLLNARGEIVGVNFDRVIEATINDYAWSESYSRSIAVDIRYVLWVTGTIGGAGHLLEEMGVPGR